MDKIVKVCNLNFNRARFGTDRKNAKMIDCDQFLKQRVRMGGEKCQMQ